MNHEIKTLVNGDFTMEMWWRPSTPEDAKPPIGQIDAAWAHVPVDRTRTAMMTLAKDPEFIDGVEFLVVEVYDCDGQNMSLRQRVLTRADTIRG